MRSFPSRENMSNDDLVAESRILEREGKSSSILSLPSFQHVCRTTRETSTFPCDDVGLM